MAMGVHMGMTIRTVTDPRPTAIPMTMGTVTRMTIDPHLTLHQLFSPAFPVGAFAYSHGLEAAVQTSVVSDVTTFRAWLDDVLTHGSGWADSVLFARAAQGDDVLDLSELAEAMTPSAERRGETMTQGRAFSVCARDVFGVDVPDLAYPVAAGRVVHLLGLPVEDAARLYLQAFAANIVSAGVRLIPLGQTDGQKLTLALSPLCAELAKKAQTASLDDIGGFVPMVDIMSQRHAGLYSKIFRS